MLGAYLGFVTELSCQQVRNKWLETLPKEEADAIRAKDYQERLDRIAHRKALEIAEAGRARNFWGK